MKGQTSLVPSARCVSCRCARLSCTGCGMRTLKCCATASLGVQPFPTSLRVPVDCPASILWACRCRRVRSAVVRATNPIEKLDGARGPGLAETAVLSRGALDSTWSRARAARREGPRLETAPVDGAVWVPQHADTDVRIRQERNSREDGERLITNHSMLTCRK
jgi:hypothetical protein